MLEMIEQLVEAVAHLGAGSASLLLTYQPKTPKRLLENEE